MAAALQVVLAGLFWLAVCSPAAAAPQKKSPAAVLTGCLDQFESDFVLRDESTLKQLALLEPVGFPKEGFAKYVGQKVKLSGTKSAGNRGATLRVRKVEVISETCTPAPEPQAPR